MRRLFCLVIVMVVCVATVLPAIPADSVTTALHESFESKMDSAATYAGNGEYQKAVRMYAASFDDLKRFNELRRVHAGKYLAELYETEQKEQRILFLDEELPLKKRLNFLLIVLCVILIGMLGALFTFLRYHLGNIRQKAEQRENENHLMELEREERVLENRLRTMEVEKYQKELLAESLLVNHKNKVLDDLRLFLVQNPKLNSYKGELEKLLGDDCAPPPGVVFKTEVNDVHPAFYARLQQQASNKLTALDLEYCRMISMKMSSKEMAELLGVEPETVRIGKYRLKRKLGLGKGEDLDGFIGEIESVY